MKKLNNEVSQYEIWKDIHSYEGLYQASNLGRFKSLKFGKEKILTPHVTGRNRLYVNLSKEGKMKKLQVHVLVALTFIGERPEGYDICHIDGDCLNNESSNLRYDTRNQNSIDYYRQGKKAPNGKLSIDEVLEIRKMYNTGDYTLQDIADKFSMSNSGISLIIRRKRFGWLNDDGTIDDSGTRVS